MTDGEEAKADDPRAEAGSCSRGRGPAARGRLRVEEDRRQFQGGQASSQAGRQQPQKGRAAFGRLSSFDASDVVPVRPSATKAAVDERVTLENRDVLGPRLLTAGGTPLTHRFFRLHVLSCGRIRRRVVGFTSFGACETRGKRPAHPRVSFDMRSGDPTRSVGGYSKLATFTSGTERPSAGFLIS